MKQIRKRTTRLMRRSLLGLATLGLGLAGAQAEAPKKLLRYADIHKDQVTFVHAGDIYIADINSGESTRLTSHAGFETFPKFSRSGQQIAFAAEYSGTRQVYVMNTDGSNLRQLTWYNDVGPMPPRGGFDYRVMDWSADDAQVLVRANRLPWGQRMGRPHWVPLDGGMAQPLAVPETGGGMLSPDGTRYVYTPIDREFRTWKRYRGGRAQDVWVFNLQDNSAEQLTDNDATDHQPVWVGDDIYFISDRDRVLNLYRYVRGGAPQQVTHHSDYDALWASAGPDAIVYEAGGQLWRFDPATGQDKRLDIRIEGNPESLVPMHKNVAQFVDSFDISPDGQRAVIAARGELFSVPASQGEIRNLSRSPAAREISASWSADGRYVAYLSDRSGEYEVYLRDLGQSGEEKRLTSDGSIWRFAPVFSPQSDRLAYADKNQTLWVVDVKGGQPKRVDRGTRNDIQDYVFSPDGRFLAYTKAEDSGYGSIWVHDLKRGKTQRVTGTDTSDFSPRFDPAGRYLYFLSNRDYNLAFSSFEFNYLYNNATRVYALQLSADGPALYPFQSDEAALPGADGDVEKGNGDAANEVNIDYDGLAGRITVLPLPPGNYNNLQANKDAVYVLSNNGNGPAQLKRVSVSEADSSATVLDGVNNYVLSANGEKILAQKNGDFAIVGSGADQKFDSGKLDLTHLTMKIDPRVEWQQMYVDAWRILRDWFYDPGTHGMDWDAVRAKYQPLVDAAAHRSDLDYVFSEIAGELNAGHIYVNAGDSPTVERHDNGLLGGEFSRHSSGYFRIDEIFAGENWQDATRSPLTEAGVQAKVGDYITAVNGVSTRTVNNLYALLEHSVGRTVTLSLNSRASDQGGWTAHVRPIASEQSLRYLKWVRERMARVDELSGGRIGYIHLPNTAQPGNRELFKQFLPQITKDALIVDDRYNGGGFIPDRMIELLSRTTLNYWKTRGLEPNATPFVAHDGPKVMLTNGYSSSGGDALPYYFRKAGLGKIIGTRTWGGLIGISGNPGLADGGSILASTFRFMDTDGNWVVENEGVSPDIEVVDRPDQVARGEDPTLERAVQELLRDLPENPRKSIAAPPAPTEF